MWLRTLQLEMVTWVFPHVQNKPMSMNREFFKLFDSLRKKLYLKIETAHGHHECKLTSKMIDLRGLAVQVTILSFKVIASERVGHVLFQILN